ncbi:hypothetical protein B0H14DRAFT_2606058 [Mycena olivaceomarginata]|nr:hypothetical protein B0H14DRAFT_2606058 [Mycena olivaceomarginata]
MGTACYISYRCRKGFSKSTYDLKYAQSPRRSFDFEATTTAPQSCPAPSYTVLDLHSVPPTAQPGATGVGATSHYLRVILSMKLRFPLPAWIDVSDIARWKKLPPFEEDDDRTDPYSDGYLRFIHPQPLESGTRLRWGQAGRWPWEVLREEVVELLKDWERLFVSFQVTGQGPVRGICKNTPHSSISDSETQV